MFSPLPTHAVVFLVEACTLLSFYGTAPIIARAYNLLERFLSFSRFCELARGLFMFKEQKMLCMSCIVCALTSRCEWVGRANTYLKSLGRRYSSPTFFSLDRGPYSTML
ncbi:MAG: hypothetical protein BYD32DRAFT_406408 [Podila humilis]|nr:MAG: hypothetical protein BYD32DRAFT_406408 [Podila humilis]